MSYQLVIPPEVEHQITGAFDSFDSTEHALAFVHDLNVLFERIVDRPLQFPVIYAAVRRALLRYHDYSVFFEVDVNRRRAVIHAVVHQHRDPALWPK
jgi:plasmid stabilization system protein ParE